MSRSFFKGLIVGLLGPLAFVAGLAYWTYRYTRKVPFPVGRPEEDAVTLKLVYPEEVPAHWQHWKAELQPLWEGLRAFITEIRVRYHCPFCETQPGE